MKVFQILKSMESQSAGPWTSVGQLSHHLVARGADVTVVTLGRRPETWPYDARLTSFDGLGRGRAVPAAVRYVRREMVDTPCVVHGHGLWSMASLVPLAASADRLPVTLWSPRGTLTPWAWNHKAYKKRPFWHTVQRRALERVRCFHATAALEIDDLRRLGFTQPVALIPNGVELPAMTTSPPGRRLVYLGRLHEKKGVDLLVEAWVALAGRFPDWELVIAGGLDGAYATRLQSMVQCRDTPRVSFIGEVTGDAKAALLADATLLVLPSHSESFGNVVAEALAAATPVITTTTTPWTDLASRGCGWSIAPRLEALVDVLLQAMGTPVEELAAMGARGRTWMAGANSWTCLAGEFEAVYAWLTNASPRPDFVH